MALFPFIFSVKGFGAGRPKFRRTMQIVIASWIAIPAFVGISVLIDQRSHRSSTPTAAVERARLLDHGNPKPTLRTQSCSTSNCHGSLTPEPRPDAIRSDEYFVWLEDPHAQAYRTLFGERSRAIFQRLGVADDRLQPLAGQQERFANYRDSCLGCHETNHQLALTRSHTDHVSLPAAEGVSCESCHGGGPGWLEGHYRSDWKSDGDTSRGHLAEVEVDKCVDCHVGNRGADVNHDLIAAGHPAMRFEYVWYKSRLPRHWRPDRREAIERNRNGLDQQPPPQPQAPALLAQDWLIGQLVSTGAALDQLERRARNLQQQGWPELAEFNCTACHNDLTGTAPRRGPNATKRLVANRKASTPMPWGNWNLELIPFLADQYDSPESREFSQAFVALRDAVIAGRHSTGDEIAAQSQATRSKLDAWTRQVSSATDAKALQLLQQIGRNAPEDLFKSWDQTANLVLGFAAPYRFSTTAPETIKNAMNRVLLPKTPVVFDSPRGFNRTSDQPNDIPWNELVKQLADSLEK